MIQEIIEEHEDDFNGCDKVNEIRIAYKSATCKKPIKGEKEILLTLVEMPGNNQQAKLAKMLLLRSTKMFLRDGKDLT